MKRIYLKKYAKFLDVKIRFWHSNKKIRKMLLNKLQNENILRKI